MGERVSTLELHAPKLGHRFREVGQQADAIAARLEVGTKLLVVMCGQLAHSFRFDDYGVVDDYVQPMGSHQAALVLDIDGDFSARRETLLLQLDEERIVVDLLEKAGAELPVHRNNAADDLLSQVVLHNAHPAILITNQTLLLSPSPTLPHLDPIHFNLGREDVEELLLFDEGVMIGVVQCQRGALGDRGKQFHIAAVEGIWTIG